MPRHPLKFDAVPLKPKSAKPLAWTFIRIPAKASATLPSRGMVCVEGTINRHPFAATLEPDGEGGHWMKIPKSLRTKAGAAAGESVTFEIALADKDPEPRVPPDLRIALREAPEPARITWSSITPAARRDFVFWITSGKKAETRAKRIATACDMLAKGNRRPCCFDRSGIFGGGLSCPEADESNTTRH